MTDETLTIDEVVIAWGDQVKAYKAADGRGVVEALGVRFSGPDQRDFYGDYFTADTDFGPHGGHGMQATVNHRIPMYTKSTDDAAAEIMQRLATYKFAHPVEAERTEAGIMVQHVLDLSNEYEAMVYELARAGHLRWSSGTAAHLVDRDKSGQIKQWPVIEWAYTPQPAEPRLPKIVPLRHLPECIIQMFTPAQPGDDIHADGLTEAKTQPKGVRNTPADVADEGAEATDQHDMTTSEVKTMNEQEKAQEAATEQPQGNDNDSGRDEVLIDLLAATKRLQQDIDEMKNSTVNDVPPSKSGKRAPVVLKNGTGDNPTKAIAAWLRSEGDDKGAVRHLLAGDHAIDLYGLLSDSEKAALAAKAFKASNATDMNITTDADGGYAVPTGHYQGIIARRDEAQISNRVGVREIPGKGTTVNVPVDNEDDGEFVATNEAAQFDLDSPAIGQVQMTLAKYTKRIMLSDELLWDEDSRLMAFVEDWVGRGMARTHNSLFMTEVLANGTKGLDLDAAAAIGAAEVPELEYKLADPYMEGATWIMKHSTVGLLRGLQASTSAGQFMFAQTPYANRNGNQFSIDGYPVMTTAYAGNVAASGKSMVFGNFGFVGVRNEPSIKLIIDPYTRADYGQVRYLYQFRTVYKVLQAEAIQYAQHPTA